MGYISISKLSAEDIKNTGTSFRWLVLKVSACITATKCTKTKEEAKNLAEELSENGRFKIVFN